MKILIDTNILLDVLCKRLKFYEESAKVLKLCEVNMIEGYISALTIPNIVYIMRKELDSKRVGELLDRISIIVSIADLKAVDLKKATNLNFNDYEDAVQSVCASRINADYIVTRNVKDFVGSKVKAVTPEVLLTEMLA